MRRHERILVAGVGNVFLGDDAFGVEVVHRLARRRVPSDVRVEDFGIRGLDLAYALTDGYEDVIIVDATPRGRPAGSLYVLEPELEVSRAHDADGAEAAQLDTHGMDPAKVLQLAHALGGELPRIRFVGCEPSEVRDDRDLAMGMSPAVSAVVDDAVELVESLLGSEPQARASHA